MRANRLISAALVAVGLLSAGPALSQAQLLQQGTNKDKAPPMPVHAWIGTTQSVGSGTFVTGKGTFNPTVQSSLSITPFIRWEGWQILVSQNIGIEWTQSDSTTTPNQLQLSDTTIGVRNLSALRLEEAALSFWPAVTYAVPISLGSRQQGSLGTFNGSFRGNYGGLSDLGLTIFGTVNAGYNITVPSLAGSFNNNDAKSLQDNRLGNVTPNLCFVRNAEELNNYVCNDGQLPSLARFGANIGAWWYYLLDGNLGFSASFGFSQSYSFFRPDDENTSPNALSGWIPRQSTSSDLSSTWVAMPWLWLTAGVSSQQPVFMENGTTPRFPVWDFVSPSNNFSSVYFDMTFVL